MEAIAGVVIQFLVELVLEILAEVLVHLGFGGVAEVFQKKNRQNPFLTFVGYAIFGLIFGVLSILIFPQPLIRSSIFHYLNPVFAPILAGLFLCFWIWWGQESLLRPSRILRLDNFLYGWVLAFTIAIIRFAFAK